MSQQSLEVAPGDVIVKQQEGGSWRVMKILQVDSLADGTSTAHCLFYNDAPDKPTGAFAGKLGVKIWHTPILASGLGSGWERISNQVVHREELIGFIEYLKHTDFTRYSSFTGQDSNDIVHQANEHYKRANHIAEQGRRDEAIAEYNRAVDLFPLFYEAIDNRAFTCMELGRFENALADFELSLHVNPDSVAAFFSKGECLLRLGQAPEAEVIFKQGLYSLPGAAVYVREIPSNRTHYAPKGISYSCDDRNIGFAQTESKFW